MTTRIAPYPEYYRVKEHRVLGGVCTGLAAHLGVELTWVRLAFAALLAAPGMAIPLYIALCIFTDSVDGFEQGQSRVAADRIQRGAAGAKKPENINRPRGGVDWVLLAIGLALAITGPALSSQQSAVSLFIGVAMVGVFLVWHTFGAGVFGGAGAGVGTGTAGGAGAGAACGTGSAGGAGSGGGTVARRAPAKWPQLTALIGGVVLLIGGTVGTLFVASSGDGGNTGGAIVGWSFLAALLVIVGFIVVLVPLWLRLWSMANKAAEERAAEAERAEIASRIHDSVLQTLTMIQKQAGDPEIVTMARSQERQLRQWLFATDESVAPETFFGAVRVACGEVEDTYGIRVRPVLVGEDLPSTDALLALALAGREAMVNAAKHSGCDEVNVFVEAEPDEPRVEMFVRDRGPGFDLHGIPEDRQGVRQSILGRMERAGGTVEFDTSPAGTEVILSVPNP